MFHVEFLTISMVVDTGYLQTFGMELLGSRHCTRVGSTSRSGSARGKLSVKKTVAVVWWLLAVIFIVLWTIDIYWYCHCHCNDYCGIFGVLVDIFMYDICIETNNRFGMSHVDSRVCLFNILPERRLELIVTCTKIVRLHEERYRMNIMNQNGRSRRGSSKWSEKHRNTGFETFRNIENALKHEKHSISLFEWFVVRVAL